MASNINPSLTPVNNLANFRFWCQKVLPLVYDDSLSYYEVLGKMVVQLNDVIDNVNADTENVLTLKDAFLALQTYVNNFFDDIDQLASYAERAEAAQTAANTSAVNAATSASNASASSLAAMDARDTAVAARQAAQASANTASTAATNANTKANEAAQSAITAQTAQASASQSATLAATDRSAAQTAASTATTKASEASTSATNAETSANNAAQSKEDAEEAANNIQENLDNIQKNTQDISDLKESITNIETKITASFEQKTITNVPVASFNDGADGLPVKRLVIDVEPAQSGTGDPSPDNVRPITGWTGAKVTRTGKNLFGGLDLAEAFRGANGFSLDTGNKTFTFNRSKADVFRDVKFKPNTQYTFIRTHTGARNTCLTWAYTDGTYETMVFPASTDKTTSRTVSTAGKTVSKVNLEWSVTGVVTVYYEESGLFEGDANVDDFEPYKGKTYDITFPSEAGTVYGGSIDVTNGELLVTDAQIASYNGESLPSTWISDRDVYAPGTTPSIGAQVVYKLATAITYQLTPIEIYTFININNIWADTGDIAELTYRAMNNTKAMIAPVLDSMVADTALVINDFRIVGNTLYKVTAPIAAGGTLTVGTNVTVTTIGEQIKALLT